MIFSLKLTNRDATPIQIGFVKVFDVQLVIVILQISILTDIHLLGLKAEAHHML
jgi:hypothetical protein